MIKRLNESKITGKFVFIKTDITYDDPDECSHSLTVKKLIDELKKYDQDAIVLIKDGKDYKNLRHDGFTTTDVENLIAGYIDDNDSTDDSIDYGEYESDYDEYDEYDDKYNIDIFPDEDEDF